MNKAEWLLILLYLFCALAYATYSSVKKNKNWFVFFIMTLIFTPIFTSFLLFRKKKQKITYVVSRYKCPRCEFKFDSQMDHCPYCEKDGYIVKLVEVSQIMT